MSKGNLTKSLLVVGLLFWVSVSAFGQGTAFTYQGKLTDNGNPASGEYDFQFKLFDTATVGTGTQIGSLVAVSNVTVSTGILTVQLDFGACATCFNGAARFLEIAVKPTSGSTFTTLSPRQPITANPYAIRSLAAATADGLSVVCVNCVTSSQIASVNGSVVSGAIPVASVPAGSSNYIQNTSSPQASSNFNISGNGTAGGTLSGSIVNAVTQVNINGLRAFTVNGAYNDVNIIFTASNTFTGEGAGVNTTPSPILNNFNGKFNAFFGAGAGQANTSGFANSFFGNRAGFNNSTGQRNTFIGTFADFNVLNPTGDNNTLLGALSSVTSGVSNATAIGFQAQVSQSNSLVLGNNANVGIGTTAPQFKLDVVGDINTTTQYNLGGLRVLSAAGMNNLFAGIGAGTTGSFNAFFGSTAGQANTTGGGNAFFGAQAGQANTTGQNNSFFGAQAGSSNNTGTANAFFGFLAGDSNTTGTQNAFFGTQAGFNNFSGASNTFIGKGADFDAPNTTGNNNTLLGAVSRVTSGITNATAIGNRAQVEQDNSLILGSINGKNGATADTLVGIGTTTPGALLDVQRDGDSNAIPETARFTTYGANNEILSRAAGGTRAAPTATPNGRILLLLGATGHAGGTDFVPTPRATILMTASEDWTASAQGTLMRFNTTTSGTTSTSTRMTIADDGNIGIGTTAPNDKLDVNGILRVATLGAAGSTALCRNASNQIATCSSSFRYKTDIRPFTSGLDLVLRLRPIRFTWKQGGARDVGFGAEEVAAVEPLFTFTNDKGEIEGVKYDRLSVVLVNAVKQQQTQIEQQQAQIETQRALIQQQQTITQRQEARLSEQRTAIERQQAELDGLKRLVCAAHPRAGISRRHR